MISDELMQTMLTNSYQNFHTKGFDYICIHRTPELTRKLYFFEGDINHLPEVISPHDHRYDFTTYVLAGTMSDSLYVPTQDSRDMYHLHEWRTPLNGGNGAEYVETVGLEETVRVTFEKGQKFRTSHDWVHTIRMHSDTCVLLLNQFADCVPVDQPTKLYRRDKEPLSLDGLYERPNADHCIKRYKQYLELIN